MDLRFSLNIGMIANDSSHENTLNRKFSDFDRCPVIANDGCSSSGTGWLFILLITSTIPRSVVIAVSFAELAGLLDSWKPAWLTPNVRTLSAYSASRLT